MKTLRKSLAIKVAIATLLFAAKGGTANAGDLPHLFVPDGQLLSRPIQIYVSSTNLNQAMNLGLRLVSFYAPGKYGVADTNVWKPYFSAGGQSWSENISGQNVSYQGTFLLFDLGKYPIGRLKSSARLMPILTWTEANATNDSSTSTLVGSPVYLGVRTMAGVWTAIVIGGFAVFICLLCRVKSGEKRHLLGVLSLISGPDNYMSLWRTQLVAWTLAVGSMVFFFGIIQLQVPQIPDSLVALMGMSVITGGLSSIAAKPQPKPSINPPPVNPLPDQDNGPDKDHTPRVSDLISSYIPDLKIVVLSVPKAQMVFWTGIILILFVTKSLLTGELWDVPWELVALTGVSQAGYVSDKALQGKPTT